MDALHLLLHDAIDYAGLFPPAGLDMGPAVRNYAAYRAGADAWALGRFIVPAVRLGELEDAAAPLLPRDSADPWRLGVLLGNELERELNALAEFNRRHGAVSGAVVGDVVEVKADSAEVIERVARSLPAELQAYIEIPIDADPAPLIDAIARRGARGKVRTGGVTAAAFPPAGRLARFLAAAVAADLPFKATAGLHHPLRAEYRLTYEGDSPRGTMYGFLNLFLAAAFLRAGMREAEAVTLLEERAADAFRISPGSIEWRGHRLERSAIEAARRRAIISFGSCSFTEPVGDLRTLGLLSAA
jgi:hypothetical protein